MFETLRSAFLSYIHKNQYLNFFIENIPFLLDLEDLFDITP